MEYYPQGSLHDLLRRARGAVEASGGGGGGGGSVRGGSGSGGRLEALARQQLGWGARLQMLYEAAAGMSYLHSRGFVHGDLRSPNLFVASDGRLKIGDFGFCQLLPPEVQKIKVASCTNPRWVAPEVLQTLELGKASDVYSFAMVMYEMLTWRIPFHEVSCSTRLLLNGMPLSSSAGPAGPAEPLAMRPTLPPDADLPGAPGGRALELYRALMEAPEPFPASVIGDSSGLRAESGASRGSSGCCSGDGAAVELPSCQIIPAHELDLTRSGAQGPTPDVFLGSWNGVEVAAKAFRSGRGCGGGDGGGGGATINGHAVPAAMAREVMAMAAVANHPNIVRFVGACLAPPLVLREHYPRGSLHQLLSRGRAQLAAAPGGQGACSRHLGWGRRLEMLVDAAMGMR
ncbi:Serine/threonine-protein kinase PAK 7 [Monoraphidium neglectum]|uniref:Serine/threonine-protein kinase PAK 7 n=1 Tax=Monoraphidium neglectum TaxID=145388 RepID=A0A0D2LP09_9CHLO|nr:Serine/threonine-protein kinase PAK 7 [Monoraphidium neglectum]KIY93519.1 Serine/threonine-protein kinase PAK 7 [Monoraphidium neglectum]|eukprot:XP_013892539.1 Serine/threonine-protein kinase PAK 7 [Monoraphidium neglectum]